MIELLNKEVIMEKKKVATIEDSSIEILTNEIKVLIETAKRQTVYSVNTIMLKAYRNIGKLIVEQEQNGSFRAEYGKSLLLKLSKELTNNFGKGFSRSNLQSMRILYLKYPKSQTLSGKLSWSHYLQLLQISDDSERGFYEKECENSNWSVRELSRQIKSSLYLRLLLSKGEVNKDKVMQLAKQGVTYNNPNDLIKDPMVLEFLGVIEAKPKIDSDLEAMILNNLQDFLLELGRGFMFVGSQERISIAGKNYYVDLVFYNKILKCYVLIDLKMNDFEAENIGQMNLYVNYYKKEVNDEGDNDPVGIILCAGKDKVVAEYSMEGLTNNIYASRYSYVMPDKDTLEEELNKYLK